MQLFAIILLPLTLLLVAITFGSVAIHQKAMRALVGERDERLVRIAAAAINAQIDLRVKELTGLQVLLSSETASPISSRLDEVGFLLKDFNHGLALADGQGKLLATEGDPQLWSAWVSDPTRWQAIFSELASEPGEPKVIQLSNPSEYTGLISVPGDLKLFVIGGFSIKSLVESSLADALANSRQLSILIVDTNRQVLFTSGEASNFSADHPGIADALQGKSGIVYVKHGKEEHVTAYNPIASAGWALITEESWETVATPTLQTSQVAPLVLVPALLIMSVALWLGASQVVRPLNELEARALTLTSGDFTSIQEPVGGIAEIQHLQVQLVEMARKVQEAQKSLHGYIGAITTAQEEERHRLARELHDDTLQALIALKQRVQLAQLELQAGNAHSPAETAELQEIITLTEQAIENLRRLTRDLRPIYLEDLGLVPALEMLARETGQAIGITIAFQRQGTEKRLDPVHELALFRIAQEALNNIAHHAEAKHASLVISFLADSVAIIVKDDGVGFTLADNLSAYAAKGHYGLLGLQERADLIGASLKIQSVPGNGTELRVTLPAQTPQTTD